MTNPVCKTCNDTHRMTQAREGDNDRVVMCTSCPVPCQLCRAGGRGAFCEKTPCRCACHVEGTATARAHQDDLHYRVRLACATLRDVVGSQGPDSIESFARRAAAKIKELEARLEAASSGQSLGMAEDNGADQEDLEGELESSLEMAYRENDRLRDLVSRAPHAWDKFCVLDGLLATEKDPNKRKGYVRLYNRIGFEFNFEPPEGDSCLRIRRAREAVEKDIVEMQG